MAAPDPYAGTPEAFTIADWKELVHNFRPSGANSFSKRSGEASLVGRIPAAKLRGALRFFTGFDNVTAAAPRLIQRTNPIYHPRYTNLVCTNAAEEEFSPDSTSAATLKLEAKSALDYSGSPLFVAPPVTHYSGYEFARVTLRFQPPSYTFAEDGSIDRLNAEFSRNVWFDHEPRTEVLSLDGFTLLYAEGENNADPVSEPKGKKFPAPFGQLLAKPDVAVNWADVPERFLIGVNRLPTKIVNGLGKVNAASWNGYPAGTLLLVGAKLVRTPWPLAAGTESAHSYQVTLLLNYFNPTKGKSNDVQIVTNLGHNNMPWKGEADEGATTPGDTNAGKWFLATRTGGSGVASVDPRLVEEYDFVELFRSAV